MILPALFSILPVLVSALAGGSLTREEPARTPNTWNGTRLAESEREGKPAVKAGKYFNPRNDARRLYKAMKGPGTTENELISVLGSRSLEQRKIISKTFTKMYGYDFEYWLYGEISGWFKSAIQGMMNPAQMLASDLRWATKLAGTDEETLIDILVPITRQELEDVKAYYLSHYKTLLRSHILDDIHDMTRPFQKLIRRLLNGRSSSWSGGKKIEVDRKAAETFAKVMYNNGSVFAPSNEDHLHQILTQTPREQLKLTLDEFQKLTGKSFGDVVKENKGGLEYWYTYALTSIADFASDSDEYFAALLSKGDYFERELRRIIVWRSDIDLHTIKKTYIPKYWHLRTWDKERNFAHIIKALWYKA